MKKAFSKNDRIMIKSSHEYGSVENKIVTGDGYMKMWRVRLDDGRYTNVFQNNLKLIDIKNYKEFIDSIPTTKSLPDTDYD